MALHPDGERSVAFLVDPIAGIVVLRLALAASGLVLLTQEFTPAEARAVARLLNDAAHTAEVDTSDAI